MQNNETPRGFIQFTMPVLIATGAFLVYLITLNHWLNVINLPVVAKVTGWDWTLPVQWPLYFTLTYPLRWLPVSIQPIALNIFAALCGALSAGLLARSVALLPHDRTHEQRLRERNEFSFLSIKEAWLPPLFAALVLILERTFWEHSTSATGETLNVLLFAYCIRCLLEFRRDKNEKWLFKTALVYALGITNDWAFLGFLPGLLVALIWMRGKSFLNGRFLGRMALCATAGLLLYLLLPIIWSLKSDNPDISFWDVLRSNIGNQKLYLFNAPPLRMRAFLLSLVSVFPVILMGIRWPSSFGDTSAAGASITNIMFRVVHLVFFGVCLYFAFDQKFSPRWLGYRVFGLPFLTFYYLGALSVGYYSGYLLLVYRDIKIKAWMRSLGVMKLINPAVRALVWIAFIAVPIGLLYINFPAARNANSGILAEFAQAICDQIPQGKAYLVSDSPEQMAIVRGYLEKTSRVGDYVFVTTKTLELPAYHRELIKEFGDRWPKWPLEKRVGDKIDPYYLLNMMTDLARSNSVYYLHSSFGYYFERMYTETRGLVYQLKLYQQDQLLPPKLEPNVEKENEVYWNKTSALAEKAISLGKKEITDALFIEGFLSKALNYWGVELQRNNYLKEAGPYFSRAADLNSNNAPAQLNLEVNKSLIDGKPILSETDKMIEQRFGRYRTWDAMLLDNGPFDHPDYCFLLAQNFQQSSLMRQAAQLYSRVTFFEPTNFLARAGLIQTSIAGGWIDRALEEINKARKDLRDSNVTNQLELISLEASAYFAKKDTAKAEEILAKAKVDYKTTPFLADVLSEFYRARGDVTNALAALDQKIKLDPTNSATALQKAELALSATNFDLAISVLDGVLASNSKDLGTLLFKAFVYIQKKDWKAALAEIEKVQKIDPENIQAILYKGVIHMESGEDAKAIEIFSSVIEKQPGNVVALRNRAIAALRSGDLKLARKDYEKLRKLTPASHAVYYGLGQIAYKEKDTKKAIEMFETYLKVAPVQGGADLQQERSEVTEKLAQLKRGNK